ncbi:nudC domain-containing protein 3 isoform X1 [Aethina tumida]|uniref:nudC domain-containing protein 3 isoform X1 n=1 Tax=Aethina tumida TaxID=116153 RepID=UPI00096B3CB5|nr:nudC domain-containing protein 3 isoform X1 [Aethina tumida]
MDNHDDMLFSMLKECQNLSVFLDHIFGFLKRRTDFYQIKDDKNSPVGLPEGVAESLVRHTFYKYQAPKEHVIPSEDIPVVSEEVLIEDVNETACTELMENLTAGDKSIFTASESYNGQIFKEFCWSQNILDVDIFVKVPKDITAKDVCVYITPDSVTVKLKDGTTLLQGSLCQNIKHNEAIWSVVNNKIEIHLDKRKDMWWDCLFKGHKKLDVSTIDCSRPYEDLPEEAQVKIQELQWNQDRRLLGLPTSDELKMHKTLQKAWDAKGSPFSGPFDPSQVQFN